MASPPTPIIAPIPKSKPPADVPFSVVVGHQKKEKKGQHVQHPAVSGSLGYSLRKALTVPDDVATGVRVVVVVDVVGAATVTVVQLGSAADAATVSVTHFVTHGSSWPVDGSKVSVQPVLVLVCRCSVVVWSTIRVVHVVVVQRLSWLAGDSPWASRCSVSGPHEPESHAWSLVVSCIELSLLALLLGSSVRSILNFEYLCLMQMRGAWN